MLALIRFKLLLFCGLALVSLSPSALAQSMGLGALAGKVDGFNQSTLLRLSALEQDKSAGSMRMQAQIKMMMAFELYEEADRLDDDECECGDDARIWGDMLLMQAMNLNNAAGNLEANANKTNEAAENMEEGGEGGGEGGGGGGGSPSNAGDSVNAARDMIRDELARQRKQDPGPGKNSDALGTSVVGGGPGNSNSTNSSSTQNGSIASNFEPVDPSDTEANDSSTPPAGPVAFNEIPGKTDADADEEGTATDSPTIASTPNQSFDAEGYGRDLDFKGNEGGRELARAGDLEGGGEAGGGVGAVEPGKETEADRAIKEGKNFLANAKKEEDPDGTEFSSGGKGLPGGFGSSKTASKGNSQSLIERAKAMLAARNGGKAPAGEEGFAGDVVFGKDKKGKSVLRYVVKSKGTKDIATRSLASTADPKGKDLFQRVSFRYRVMMKDLLSFDWYLNNKIKKAKQ